MRHNITIYESPDRPDVEVEPDSGDWLPGEVRMRWRGNDGAWWAAASGTARIVVSTPASAPIDVVIAARAKALADNLRTEGER